MGKQGEVSRRRTLQDVADALGLSVNTVSRAIRDMPGVGETTRARIKAEAERIGYVPNAHARSLVLGSRKTIGVVLTDLANPFFSDLVAEIEDRVIQAGYTLLLLLSDEDPEREAIAVETALGAGVDGILAVPVQGRSNPWKAVIRAGVPLVFMSREVPGIEVDLYSHGNRSGRSLSAQTVIDRGARNIVVLEEDIRITTVGERLAGYRSALERNDIPFEERNVVTVPSRRTVRGASLWRGEDAYRMTSDLLSSGYVPDAFLASNDFFALGIYAALRERGLRVPDDVLVVGWGDYPFARYLDPPLSSMPLPAAQMAERAVKRMLSLLDGTAEPGHEVEYFNLDLMLRASTND